MTSALDLSTLTEDVVQAVRAHGSYRQLHKPLSGELSQYHITGPTHVLIQVRFHVSPTQDAQRLSFDVAFESVVPVVDAVGPVTAEFLKTIARRVAIRELILRHGILNCRVTFDRLAFHPTDTPNERVYDMLLSKAFSTALTEVSLTEAQTVLPRNSTEHEP